MRLQHGAVPLALWALLVLAWESSAAPGPRPASGAEPGWLAKFSGSQSGRITKLYGARSAPYPGMPMDAGLRFLKERAEAIGIAPDGSDITSLRIDADGTGAHTWYRRKAFGLPVLDSLLAVHMDGEGRVLMMDNVAPEIRRMAAGPDRLTAGEAVEPAIQVAGRPRRMARIRTGEKLLHVRSGTATPAWKVIVTGLDPPTDREVYVSTIDGTVLESRDRLFQATGTVFAPPPPVHQQNYTLRDRAGTDYTDLSVSYQRVIFEKDSSTFLRGQFADLISRIDENGDPVRAGESSRVYNYNRFDPRFAEVNAYFHIDNTQRFIRARTGILTVSPGSIPVQAHAIPDQNAFYSGSSRSIFFGDGGVDAAEDADVVVHEYGHAILDFMVPGISSTDGRALHEGWADFLSATITSQFSTLAGTPDPDPACSGEWLVSTDFSTPTQGGGRCLRRTDDAEGFKRYPENLDPEREVHNDGELWSRTLWEIRQGFTDTANNFFNRGLGNDATLRLALRANRFFTPTMSFPDAARALVTADLQDTNGANARVIVQAAIRRGLLPVQINSISPTFALLGTTTTVELTGEGFIGASGCTLSDGVVAALRPGGTNTRLLISVPARDSSIPVGAVVANVGTTGTGLGLRIGFDDHPNNADAIRRLPNPTRDTLSINAAPVLATIEQSLVQIGGVGGVTTQEVDVFRFTVVKDHDYTVRTGAGTARDTVLSVFGPDGRTLVAPPNDNVNIAAGDLTSEVKFRAVGFTTQTTTFFAQIGLNPGLRGTYTVTIADPATPDDHPNRPLETRDPTDTIDDRGTVANGAIDYVGDIDYFRFEAQAGAVYDVTVSLGTLSDSFVRVLDRDGTTERAQNDDTPRGLGDRSSLILGFQAKSKGTHFVEVKHASAGSALASGSYGVAVTRRAASLDVKSVHVPSARVSRGQATPVPITVSMTNTGSSTLSALSARLLFTVAGRSRTQDYEQVPSGVPASLAPGATAAIAFAVKPLPSAITGAVRVNAAVAGTDARANPASVPSSEQSTSFTLEGKALLAIPIVQSQLEFVSLGQTAPLTVVVSNPGEATVGLSSVLPVLRIGTDDRSSRDYAIASAPAFAGDNPDRLLGGQTATYRFQVGVNSTATLGRVSIGAAASGVDLNSGELVPPRSNADVPDSWGVQRPAGLALLRLDVPGPRLSTGRTTAVTLTVANGGEAGLRITTAAFQFTSGATDRGAEYAVQPAFTNPSLIGGQALARLEYRITPTSAATAGTIALGVSVRGEDVNSRAPFASTGGGLSQSLTVEKGAQLNVLAIRTSVPNVSRGGAFDVSVDVENSGQATAVSVAGGLQFRGAGNTSRDADFTVQSDRANSEFLVGRGTGTLKFRVIAGALTATGPITIAPSVTARDFNSGTLLAAGATGIAAGVTIQIPASLAITALTLGSSLVSRGGSAPVTVTLRNDGEAAITVGAALVSLTSGSGLVGATEYSFLAAPTNPLSIAGGAAASLRYTLRASNRALPGTFGLDVLQLGQDANSGLPLSARSPDSQRRTFRLGFLAATVLSPVPSQPVFAGEAIAFRASVIEDSNVPVPEANIRWSDETARSLGSGSSISALFDAGSHLVTLAASSASGFTTAVPISLLVSAPQPPRTIFVVSGIVRGSVTQAAGAGLAVTVRNLTRGLVESRTTDATGNYSIAFFSATAPVAASGDSLEVEVRDGAGRVRAATPARATIRNLDLLLQRRSLDLSLAEIVPLTFNLDAGLNLISFPAQPVTSGAPYDIAALLRDSGAHFAGRVPITGNPANDRLILEMTGSAGSVAPIEASHGYLLSMPSARTVVLTGQTWAPGSGSRFLAVGVNLVGLPGTLPAGSDTAALARATGSASVTTTERGRSGRGEFKTWAPGLAPFPIVNGKGYIVVPRIPGGPFALPGN